MSLHEIHWEITNKCNLQCKHCLSMSGSARVNELSTEEAMTALETFRSAGAFRICFTGGEAFSRKDFPSLLEWAVALGIKVAVVTNATMLDRIMLETVRTLGVELGVSLDGANSVTNDTIRGQNNFQQVVEALKQC